MDYFEFDFLIFLNMKLGMTYEDACNVVRKEIIKNRKEMLNEKSFVERHDS